MKYAIVQHSGRQFKVQEGDVVEVDLMKDAKPESDYNFDQVLLVVDDKPHIGKPTVAGAKVTGKVIGNIKGDKIRVAKYKAKVRYRRVTGFRPQFTKIKIEKINVK